MEKQEALLEDIKVSVLVATYNPKWEKLALTILSALHQERVRIQIVVTDDGSIYNCFNEIKDLFKKNDFTDFELVPGESNQGTVLNVQKGLEVCNGHYVKPISPGDFFATADALYGWLVHLNSSEYKWSICEALYYRCSEKGFIPVVENTHPISVKPYSEKDEYKIRWNYLVLDDIALGASTICEKQLLKEYINEVAGKVIYAEDNVYRLMMYDGEVADYYSKELIMYEYGDGISTIKSQIWDVRIGTDWRKTDEIIMSRNNERDVLQAKVRKKILNKEKDLLSQKIILRILRIFRKRKTNNIIPNTVFEFLDEININM